MAANATGIRMDLFFKGMQNKETTASAWLATLLRDDQSFRREFFAEIPVEPRLDPEDDWTVAIETPLGRGSCDITLESTSTYVFLENKLSGSAVTDRQFIGYYEGAVADSVRAAKRVIGIYLGPHDRTGAAERDLLRGEDIFAGRHQARRDEAVCIGWKTHLPRVAERAGSEDNWFVHRGLEAILDHVDAVERGRPFDQQREDLRRLMARAAGRVMAAGDAANGWGPGVHFVRWASRRQEVLYTPDQAITAWLTLRYAESDDDRYEVRDVFVGDVVNVHASVSFNPSSKIGVHNKALMERWGALTESRAVEVAGIGMVPARSDIAFEFGFPFDRSPIELEDLLVEWGVSVLAFLKPYRD